MNWLGNENGPPQVNRDVVVIGGSAGGLDALTRLVRELPADFHAAILVVLHIPAHVPSELHRILARETSLPVAPAVNGELIQPGRIYVASADRHLMIEDDHIRLTRGPRENRTRPAIDVLFRSAAYNLGARVIGVLLSGLLDDGTPGLWAIKDRGGIALVQSPDEAFYPSMPESAIEHVRVDAVLPVQELAATLVEWTQASFETEEAAPASESMQIEYRIELEENPLEQGILRLGPFSSNTCPECHGTMVKIQEGSIVRFRCHTGHSYSIQTLLAHVNETIDDHVWSAIRAIDERILVLHQMAEMAQREDETAQCLEQVKLAGERVEVLRQLVLDTQNLGHNPAELPAQKFAQEPDTIRREQVRE